MPATSLLDTLYSLIIPTTNVLLVSKSSLRLSFSKSWHSRSTVSSLISYSLSLIEGFRYNSNFDTGPSFEDLIQALKPYFLVSDLLYYSSLCLSFKKCYQVILCLQFYRCRRSACKGFLIPYPTTDVLFHKNIFTTIW